MITAKNLLPAHWKPGMMYDTGVQMNEYIRWEDCGSINQCPEDNW